MEFLTVVLALVVIALWVRSSNLKQRLRELERRVEEQIPFVERISILERALHELRKPVFVPSPPAPPPPPPPPVWEPAPEVPALVFEPPPPVPLAPPEPEPLPELEPEPEPEPVAAPAFSLADTLREK